MSSICSENLATDGCYSPFEDPYRMLVTGKRRNFGTPETFGGLAL
jgi:hypothetical protein